MHRSILAAALFASLLSPALHAGDNAKEPTDCRFENPRGWDLSIGVDTGWRQDDFQWTIAGQTNGRNPNILSDLDWTGLDIVPATLTVDLTFLKNWRARLLGSYGWIVDGQNRDSDYYLNNRRGEFSRSTADTEGRTIDAEFAIGYDLPELFQRVTFTPWVGISYHNQKLEDTNGVQVVDTFYGELGRFSGLNSSYDAEWFGVSFGLDASIKLTDTARLLLGARYELADYQAEADWNLRPDLRGFDHDANGDGWRLNAGLEWDFAKNWTFAVNATWSIFKTDAGVDRTYFSDGSASNTRLNEVEWDSFSVTAGVTYHF